MTKKKSLQKYSSCVFFVLVAKYRAGSETYCWGPVRRIGGIYFLKKCVHSKNVKTGQSMETSVRLVTGLVKEN